MQKDNLTQKIDPYLQDFSKKKFLHTSPHHDDSVLGYFPIVQHLLFNTQSPHHFATMTSGFNSVADEYLIKNLESLEATVSANSKFSFYVDKNYETKMFFDGISKNDQKIQDLAKSIRTAKDILEVYNAENNLDNIIKYINQIKLDLNNNLRDNVNRLKGMIRDWEEEIAWGHLGIDCSNISHMKLSFYESKDEKLDLGQDIQKVVCLLEKVDPDVVTVASEQDPIGHKTHIKVFKIVSQAIKLYLQRHPLKKLNVWEYRNVWCQFEPSEVNLFFPVTMSDFYTLKNVFINSYKSQVKALFPVPGCDMPFCDVMQKIMHEQFQKARVCIGQQYFDKHQNTRVKATQGLCFVISLDAKQFLIKNNLD